MQGNNSNDNLDFDFNFNNFDDYNPNSATQNSQQKVAQPSYQNLQQGQTEQPSYQNLQQRQTEQPSYQNLQQGQTEQPSYQNLQQGQTAQPSYQNLQQGQANRAEDMFASAFTEKKDPMEESPRIVNTHADEKNGQEKCPKCGATDISLNKNKGLLRCNFCRHEFEPIKVKGLEKDIHNLSGQVLASGAQDIVEDVPSLMTLKCTSCGAEVIIDVEEQVQARCHWCRNTLSINEQIPNGAVPDVVLPFAVVREEAETLIDKFVKKRRFFAHPKFKREFTLNNIMGVYFPYMIVDVNGHAKFVGQGEHLVREYTVGSGDDKKTYYDADLYDVEREFDIAINGLTIESSEEKLRKNDKSRTNNIINSIMPFDVENAVKWNANYIKGYSSEKRDVNVDFLKPMVQEQSEDIARFAANDTLEFYDRGVKWASQRLDVKGQQWQAAHLPVWLYSYYQENGSSGKMHYVAVNARTRETMGSVPIHMPKLLFTSFIVEILSGFTALKIESEDGGEAIFLTIGFIFFFVMYSRYRNSGARHTHELETKRDMTNIRKEDNFVSHRKRLDDERMEGANNERVLGNQFKDGINIKFSKSKK